MHYVYVSFRSNGSPFYVGKGSGRRAFEHKHHGEHYRAIVARSGGDVPVVVVREELTETEAYELEETLIRTIGIERDGGLLINQGYGGRGGPHGVKRSVEWRKTRSERAKEMWQSPISRLKRAVSLNVTNTRPEVRQRRSESAQEIAARPDVKQSRSKKLMGNKRTLGYKHTDDARQKMSIAARGRPKTQAHRDAIAAALIGKKRPTAVINKIHDALTGRRLSAAHVGAIREGHQRRIQQGLTMGPPRTRARLEEPINCAQCGRSFMPFRGNPKVKCCGVTCSNIYRAWVEE